MTKNSSEYKEGQKARAEGKSSDACPYPFYPRVARRRWKLGYHERTKPETLGEMSKDERKAEVMKRAYEFALKHGMLKGQAESFARSNATAVMNLFK